MAVNQAPKDEPLEKVIAVIEKISESNIRQPLFNWFFFFRSQSLIGDKKLDEARKLASRVTELDQRAYLFTRIAEASLKENEDQTVAREMFNEISGELAKAPKTIVSARALLALAHLYAKIDPIKAIEELAHAVQTSIVWSRLTSRWVCDDEDWEDLCELRLVLDTRFNP